MRNRVVFVLTIVIGAVLVAGLRGDRTLDVVRSIWSMKPPRAATVEKVLTLDLPPFAETVAASDSAEVRAAETAGTMQPSSPGGGAGGAALEDPPGSRQPPLPKLRDTR